MPIIKNISNIKHVRFKDTTPVYDHYKDDLYHLTPFFTPNDITTAGTLYTHNETGITLQEQCNYVGNRGAHMFLDNSWTWYSCSTGTSRGTRNFILTYPYYITPDVLEIHGLPFHSGYRRDGQSYRNGYIDIFNENTNKWERILSNMNLASVANPRISIVSYNLNRQYTFKRLRFTATTVLHASNYYVGLSKFFLLRRK